ncbi:MAG: small, acid-soluble spore protein, alpha/beta type [Clostridiaceae bacterium]|mgnify:FL=1|jgi:small acid-soluble spore protein F (minor alpha/beta-type SASP)|nr:small, acid-soluble spore protein, alpha/beta type [Clostridiaceae bacterium]
MMKKDEQLKLEIAKELGLYDKIKEHGWKSLSPKETGRIGGILSRKKKKTQIG